jgi:hypothetical protein
MSRVVFCELGIVQFVLPPVLLKGLSAFWGISRQPYC